MKMMFTTAIATELSAQPVVTGTVPASVHAIAALAAADAASSGAGNGASAFVEKVIDFCQRLQEIVSSTSEVCVIPMATGWRVERRDVTHRTGGGGTRSDR